jgi:hypothetical protein
VAFDPQNTGKRKKLFSAIAKSRQEQRRHREARVKLLGDYVGHIYCDSTELLGAYNFERPRKVVRPLLWQAASAYTHALVGPRPGFLVTTQHPELDGFASRFGSALNRLSQMISLGRTLEAAVLDAFFGFGIVKVFPKEVSGIMSSIDSSVSPLMPHAARVSPDDVVWSASSRSLRELTFVEHTYYLPLESLRKSELVDPKVLKKIEGSEEELGDEEGGGKARDLSGDSALEQEYREMTKVREVWLPFEGKAFVFGSDPDAGCLWDVEWSDPSQGPYHWLSFDDVPDNVQPISTAAQLSPLFDSINSILRKIVSQAKRAKQNVGYTGGAADDAKRHKDARDGEVFLANNWDGVFPISYGGPDQVLIAAEQKLFNDFDESAGNLSMMAGLGPQSETATQDKIIKQNVSERMSKMQGRVLELTSGIGRQLGTLLWNNESMVIPYRVASQGYETSGAWREKSYEPGPSGDPSRLGRPDDYDFEVVPYSMVPSSPAQRLALIEQTFQVMGPYLQLIMQQGAVPNFQLWLRKRAEYLNIPEIAQLIEFVGPVSEMEPGPLEQRQDAVTERHNVRHNEGSMRTEQQRQISELMKGAGQNNGAQVA